MLSARNVMQAWRATVANEDPWRSMPLDDREGELHRVVEELLDASGGLESEARRRRIRIVAVRHGEFRSAQRCGPDVVTQDFLALRLSIKWALRRIGEPNSAIRDFVRLLLPDWRDARRAACACTRRS